MSTITPLPDAPTRDDPDNFSARGDALMTALPDFVTEVNVVVGEIVANTAAAASSAGAASLSETNAAASALAANLSAGVTQWVSGTYSTGSAVWSPLSLLTYRARTSGSKPTDPSLDGANWRCLNGQSAWQIKTGNYTAQAGDRVSDNTTSSSWTLTLPASPATADAVSIMDYAGTFSINKLTVARNGQKIMSLAEDMEVTTNNASFTLEYVDVTQGWRII